MQRKFLVISATMFIIIGTAFLVYIITQNVIIQDANDKSEPSDKNVPFTALDKESCLQKNGEWIPIPGLCSPDGNCGYRCDSRTNDAGKECYSNSECEGACLCTEQTDIQGYQLGQCSYYKYFTDVIDCPCTLETKTTNRYNTDYCT